MSITGWTHEDVRTVIQFRRLHDLPCTRCNTHHERSEPCHCPACGSTNLEPGRHISGDYDRGHGNEGIDVEEIVCADCDAGWWW